MNFEAITLSFCTLFQCFGTADTVGSPLTHTDNVNSVKQRKQRKLGFYALQGGDNIRSTHYGDIAGRVVLWTLIGQKPKVGQSTVYS